MPEIMEADVTKIMLFLKSSEPKIRAFWVKCISVFIEKDEEMIILFTKSHFTE